MIYYFCPQLDAMQSVAKCSENRSVSEFEKVRLRCGEISLLVM